MLHTGDKYDVAACYPPYTPFQLPQNFWRAAKAVAPALVCRQPQRVALGEKAEDLNNVPRCAYFS